MSANKTSNRLNGWRRWPALRAGRRELLLAVASLALPWTSEIIHAACITEPIMGGADPAVIYTNGLTAQRPESNFL